MATAAEMSARARAMLEAWAHEAEWDEMAKHMDKCEMERAWGAYTTAADKLLESVILAEMVERRRGAKV